MIQPNVTEARRAGGLRHRWMRLQATLWQPVRKAGSEGGQGLAGTRSHEWWGGWKAHRPGWSRRSGSYAGR